MIDFFFIVAFLFNLALLATDTDTTETPVRVKFRGLTAEQRASIQLDLEQPSELDQLQQQQCSSEPNSPSKRQRIKKPLKSSHSEPSVISRFSPRERILRALSSQKSTSATGIFPIFVAQEPNYQELPTPPQKNCGKHNKKKKRSLRSFFQKTEEQPTVGVLPSPRNPRYGEYTNHYLAQREASFLRLLEDADLDRTIFEPLRQLPSLELRKNATRQSSAEHRILRELWRPLLTSFFSNFQTEGPAEELPEWIKLINGYLGTHVHAIPINEANQRKQKDPPKPLRMDGIQKQIADWNQMIEEHQNDCISEKTQQKFENNGALYLDFIGKLTNVVVQAPREFKFYFYYLAQALKQPQANGQPIEENQVERLVLANFFQVIVIPVILNMRISVVLDRHTFNELEEEIVSKDFNGQFPIKDQEKIVLLQKMIESMAKKVLDNSSKEKDSEVVPNPFELQLMQLLNKSFDSVVRQCEPDSFIGQIEATKQKLIAALLKRPLR